MILGLAPTQLQDLALGLVQPPDVQIFLLLDGSGQPPSLCMGSCLSGLSAASLSLVSCKDLKKEGLWLQDLADKQSDHINSNGVNIRLAWLSVFQQMQTLRGLICSLLLYILVQKTGCIYKLYYSEGDSKGIFSHTEWQLNSEPFICILSFICKWLIHIALSRFALMSAAEFKGLILI